VAHNVVLAPLIAGSEANNVGLEWGDRCSECGLKNALMAGPASFDGSPLQGGGTAGEPCGEACSVGRLAALPVPNHAT
jgi:hypothetical protein